MELEPVAPEYQASLKFVYLLSAFIVPLRSRTALSDVKHLSGYLIPMLKSNRFSAHHTVDITFAEESVVRRPWLDSSLLSPLAVLEFSFAFLALSLLLLLVWLLEINGCGLRWLPKFVLLPLNV